MTTQTTTSAPEEPEENELSNWHVDAQGNLVCVLVFSLQYS